VVSVFNIGIKTEHTFNIVCNIQFTMSDGLSDIWEQSAARNESLN